MATKPDIFERFRLSPGQLEAVAGRRFADADYLRRSGRNAHANGAMYLAGFVLECLLKAELLRTFPWLGRPSDPARRSPSERRLFLLCYQRHDLGELLQAMPHVSRRLLKADPSGRVDRELKSPCSTWSVFARYSPRTSTMHEADRFLDTVEEVKEWLKH